MFLPKVASLVFLALSLGVNSQTSPDQVCYDLWPQGPGQPVTPQEPGPELTQLLQQVNPDRIQAIIEKLVSFGTRSTLSTQNDTSRGIGAARDWIAQEMRSFGGKLNVTVPSYIQEPSSRIPKATRISNIVATLEGSVNPNRVYVVSGHYDSRVTDVLNADSDAPGADDDASGVAVSMELARIFANTSPPATMMFVAVAGEEQGLFGSAFLAQQLKSAGKDVQGMLNNDIVGSSTADDGTKDANHIRMFLQGIPPTENLQQIQSRADVGGENDAPTRQLGRFIVEVASNDVTGITVEPDYRPDRYLRGGDHLSFLDQGFSAVRFTEPNENFAHQHQDVRLDPVTGQQFGDLIEFVDFEFTAGVAKVNGAALWSLANAPGLPTNVSLDTSVLTNNSTLRWLPPAGGSGESDLVDSYEIVWRPTDINEWTSRIDVGKVNSATVKISKDNVQFGVRSVSANGLKSPAVYPL